VWCYEIVKKGRRENVQIIQYYFDTIVTILCYAPMKPIFQYNRKSIRLKEYDYSQAGEYFITICTYNHECTLGEIVDGEIKLNEIGRILEEEWLRTAIIRSNILIDSYVIMPNHIHGIIILNEDITVGANCHSPRNKIQNDLINNRAYIDTPLQNSFHSPSKTIGAIVRGFKSITTKRINKIRNTVGNPVWQRNYYEHIIRNDKELNNIRDYIANNIIQWSFDTENPQNIPL